MSRSDYKPWDRDEKLGEPPWKADDPKVVAWEQAHGHDVRLKCYVELGCQLVEPALDEEIRTLCELGEELVEAVRTGHSELRLAKAIRAWDRHMQDRFLAAIEGMS